MDLSCSSSKSLPLLTQCGESERIRNDNNNNDSETRENKRNKSEYCQAPGESSHPSTKITRKGWELIRPGKPRNPTLAI